MYGFSIVLTLKGIMLFVEQKKTLIKTKQNQK